jgi:predicted RecA/RadA family phage recombinase
MKNYVQAGSVITITAPRDLASGELVAVGALVGYTQTAAAEGSEVAIVTDGVYAVSVAAEADIAVGDVIYLAGQTLTAAADDGAETPAANTRVGIAVTAGVSDGALAGINVKLGG